MCILGSYKELSLIGTETNFIPCPKGDRMNSQLFCFCHMHVFATLIFLKFRFPGFATKDDFATSFYYWLRNFFLFHQCLMSWLRNKIYNFFNIIGIGGSCEVRKTLRSHPRFEASNVAKSGNLTLRNRRVAKQKSCETWKVANPCDPVRK